MSIFEQGAVEQRPPRRARGEEAFKQLQVVELVSSLPAELLLGVLSTLGVGDAVSYVSLCRKRRQGEARLDEMESLWRLWVGERWPAALKLRGVTSYRKLYQRRDILDRRCAPRLELSRLLSDIPDSPLQFEVLVTRKMRGREEVCFAEVFDAAPEGSTTGLVWNFLSEGLSRALNGADVMTASTTTAPPPRRPRADSDPGPSSSPRRLLNNASSSSSSSPPATVFYMSIAAFRSSDERVSPLLRHAPLYLDFGRGFAGVLDFVVFEHQRLSIDNGRLRRFRPELSAGPSSVTDLAIAATLSPPSCDDEWLLELQFVHACHEDEPASLHSDSLLAKDDLLKILNVADWV